MEAVYFIQLVVFIHSMGREMFIETCLVRVHICYILGVIGSQERTQYYYNNLYYYSHKYIMRNYLKVDISICRLWFPSLFILDC